MRTWCSEGHVYSRDALIWNLVKYWSLDFVKDIVVIVNHTTNWQRLTCSMVVLRRQTNSLTCVLYTNTNLGFMINVAQLLCLKETDTLVTNKKKKKLSEEILSDCGTASGVKCADVGAQFWHLYAFAKDRSSTVGCHDNTFKELLTCTSISIIQSCGGQYPWCMDFGCNIRLRCFSSWSAYVKVYSTTVHLRDSQEICFIGCGVSCTVRYFSDISKEWKGLNQGNRWLFEICFSAECVLHNNAIKYSDR